MREKVKDALKRNKYNFYHLGKTYFGFTDEVCSKAYADLKKEKYHLLSQCAPIASTNGVRVAFYRINTDFLKANYYKYKTN